MNLAKRAVQRVAEPVVLRFFQWRGDPVARLLLPETKADPYRLYTEIRGRAGGRGLVRSSLGPWVTANHASVSEVLRDRTFSSSPVHRRGYRPPEPDDGAGSRSGSGAGGGPDGAPDRTLLTMDPPDHTRVRRFAGGVFGPRAVRDLEEFVHDTTERLLADVDAASGFDVIAALALPLPVAVICHLLGVPAQDQALFVEWGHDVAATLEPQTDHTAATRSREAERALASYLRACIDRQRAEPDGSLLSDLVAARERGEELSADELLGVAMLLLVAGFETTVNLIGNGVAALVSHPTEWSRLHEDPSLVEGAVEEVLRYDAPVQLTSRTATVDTTVGEVEISRGTEVIVAIGGANRDPEVFEEPGRLRVDRADANRHLSFSLGLHHCMGAGLARLEGRIALDALARRYPRLTLGGAPRRRPLLVLRGYEYLPVVAGGPGGTLSGDAYFAGDSERASGA